MNRCASCICVVVTMFVSACGSPSSPGGGSGPAISLTANIVDPLSVNAVSQFNSCVGHAYPQPSSPNSAKNYFWPNSANFSSNDQLALYAACDGTTGQNSSDTNDPTSTRGSTIHLWCDNSSTSLRYFHINAASGVPGRKVKAGDTIGYAAMVGPGQSPSSAWQFSSNFDVAVSDGDDSSTLNYFSKLSSSAFGAWASRGVTSVGQTSFPGFPSCTSFSSDVGQPGILTFTPIR